MPGVYAFNESDNARINDLILKAGTEETADYHLGFYYDSDGDLAQVDD